MPIVRQLSIVRAIEETLVLLLTASQSLRSFSWIVVLPLGKAMMEIEGLECQPRNLAK
jgi:hypothetical protein